MAIRKKATTNEINAIINRGGKTISDSKQASEIKFVLRIPKELTDKIDDDRKTMPGKVSRNQWIIEAIHNYLMSE